MFSRIMLYVHLLSTSGGIFFALTSYPTVPYTQVILITSVYSSGLYSVDPLVQKYSILPLP